MHQTTAAGSGRPGTRVSEWQAPVQRMFRYLCQAEQILSCCRHVKRPGSRPNRSHRHVTDFRHGPGSQKCVKVRRWGTTLQVNDCVFGKQIDQGPEESGKVLGAGYDPMRRTQIELNARSFIFWDPFEQSGQPAHVHLGVEWPAGRESCPVGKARSLETIHASVYCSILGNAHQ